MTQSEEIELDIEDAKKLQLLRDECLTLLDSPAFKSVVEESYFKVEAARLTMAKSANLSAEQLKQIDVMQYGVGAFKNYLTGILRRGTAADDGIKESEAELTAALEEEAAQ